MPQPTETDVTWACHGCRPSQPFLAYWTLERGARHQDRSPGPEHCLQARTASTRRFQPLSRASLPEHPGKWGLSKRNNVRVSSDPVAARAFSHGAASELDPHGPTRQHQPHPFRLVEVSYLIGSPWPTSEENVRMLC